MLTLDDTIAAIATAAGPAGLAVVRVSGSRAFAVADHVFRGRSPLVGAPSHTLHHGWVLDPDRAEGPDARIDEVVAAVFHAPRSYTREHVVELSCHGGELSSRRLLVALIAAGARPARPGEFTLRAFLNGRIDLAQAEAIADVIHASTERAHALAVSQLGGGLSTVLGQVTERLTDAVAEVEARVDFAEDVGGVEVPPHVVTAIGEVAAQLGAMLEGAAYGRALRDGAQVPIVGRPNVGKSSLFNALVGEERAIVTARPGTTRDRVSEAIEIEGVRVTLSDTAGLRDTADPVEAIGVGLAEQAIDTGALAIWVLDASRGFDSQDAALAARLAGRRVLVVLNKIDCGERLGSAQVTASLGDACAAVVRASALREEGIAEIRSQVGRALGAAGNGRILEGQITSVRHAAALERAHGALRRAETVARRAAPGEIVVIDLREALTAIGEVTGAAVGEDVLDRIFSRFCIGK